MKGVGVEPNHTTAKKPDRLLLIQSSMENLRTVWKMAREIMNCVVVYCAGV